MRHGGSELKRSNSGMGGGVLEGSGGGERGAAMSCLVEAPGWGGGGRRRRNLTAAIPDGVPGVIVVVDWKGEVVFEGSSREG